MSQIALILGRYDGHALAKFPFHAAFYESFQGAAAYTYSEGALIVRPPYSLPPHIVRIKAGDHVTAYAVSLTCKRPYPYA
eukprot:9490327-Pyramimonas_sp.AAC.1